jgi:branched-chain amino acid transport system ATP-binding protein
MLEVEDLFVEHGSVDAVRGVCLAARQAGITALLGPNGAGKSSLLRAISGLARVRSGRILLDGQDITRLPTHRRAARGLAQTLQGRQVFGKLTVQANLRLAWRFGRRSRSWAQAIEQAFASFPALAEARDTRAGQLSGALQQQLIVLSATICIPSCLLLDEPSLGLSPTAQQEIYAFIAETRRQHGTTILLAEQTPRLPMQISDYGYVMRRGDIVAEGTAQVLIEAGVIPALSTAYV